MHPPLQPTILFIEKLHHAHSSHTKIVIVQGNIYLRKWSRRAKSMVGCDRSARAVLYLPNLRQSHYILNNNS